MAGILACSGDVTILSGGVPSCSGEWLLQPLPVPFTVDEAVISACAQAFGVGFSLVFFCWATGYGIRAILSLFR